MSFKRSQYVYRIGDQLANRSHTYSVVRTDVVTVRHHGTDDLFDMLSCDWIATGTLKFLTRLADRLDQRGK